MQYNRRTNPILGTSFNQIALLATNCKYLSHDHRGNEFWIMTRSTL